MGVHTASAAECAARVPPTAYGFQWDCSGKREKKACIVLRSGADCRFLRASGCGSQVYINASRPVPPAPAPSPHGKHWPEGTEKPTGELCGSAFFVQLNTKLHALQPDNESFAAEIEKTILNVAMAAIDGEHNGHQPVGIRYFANMHKHKQLPTRVASCCENHGTHLLGALPQHIFSLPPPEDTEAAGSVVTAARVNLFAASRLSITVPGAGGSHGVNATVAVETAWPSTPAVTVTVITPAALRAFDLVIRIPGWVSVGSVALTVNGSTWEVAGQPGSYVHLAMSPWPAGETTVAFQLPMKLKAHRCRSVQRLLPLRLHHRSDPSGWHRCLERLHGLPLPPQARPSEPRGVACASRRRRGGNTAAAAAALPSQGLPRCGVQTVFCGECERHLRDDARVRSARLTLVEENVCAGSLCLVKKCTVQIKNTICKNCTLQCSVVRRRAEGVLCEQCLLYSVHASTRARAPSEPWRLRSILR